MSRDRDRLSNLDSSYSFSLTSDGALSFAQSTSAKDVLSLEDYVKRSFARYPERFKAHQSRVQHNKEHSLNINVDYYTIIWVKLRNRARLCVNYLMARDF